MKTFILLTVLILQTGCAVNGEWSKADTTREIIIQTGILADALMTNQIRNTPGVEEGNPITVKFIGHQPEPDAILMWWATYSFSRYMISRALPPKWRKWWQYAGIVNQAQTIYDGCQITRCF